MVFDVAFIVADVRPLLGKERRLVHFLRSLHRKNETIRCSPEVDNPYYRSIGALNTWKPSRNTYFNAHNAVKFPLFQKHQIPVDSKAVDLTLFRKDHFRRYFTSACFGVVNCLKIGFEFSLISNHAKKIDGQALYETLKFLFSIQGKVNKGKFDKKVGELGLWLGEMVRKGTLNDRNPFFRKVLSFFPFFGKSSKHVKSVGIVATLEYTENEIESLPRDVVKLDCTNELLEIYSYDIRLMPLADAARVYFIKKGAGCSETDLKQVKKQLFLIQSNFLCLDFVIDKISLSNKQQNKYIENMEWENAGIAKSDFAYLLSDVVFDEARNNEIQKRISALRKLHQNAAQVSLVENK